jgi:hypothetical protein
LATLSLTLAILDTVDIIIATEPVVLHILTWDTVDVVLVILGITVVRTILD